jgi:hypothetical protein
MNDGRHQEEAARDMPGTVRTNNERRGEEKASFSSPADQDYLAFFAFFTGFFAFLTAFLAFAFLAGFLVVVFFAFFTATLRLSHLIGLENAFRIRVNERLVKCQRVFFVPATLVMFFIRRITNKQLFDGSPGAR